MSLFGAIDISGSGLSAERLRMDVTAENLANAQSTRGADGQPYRRKEVVLQERGGSFGATLSAAMSVLWQVGWVIGGGWYALLQATLGFDAGYALNFVTVITLYTIAMILYWTWFRDADRRALEARRAGRLKNALREKLQGRARGRVHQVRVRGDERRARGASPIA